MSEIVYDNMDQQEAAETEADVEDFLLDDEIRQMRDRGGRMSEENSTVVEASKDLLQLEQDIRSLILAFQKEYPRLNISAIDIDSGNVYAAGMRSEGIEVLSVSAECLLQS